VNCTQCHTNNQFTGLSTTCFACHQQNYASSTNPPHQSLSFPQTCLTCHSMNGWRPARYDHTQTLFPLTGAHVSTTCSNCHTNGNFQLRYTDCYGCHQSKYIVSTALNHPTNQLSHRCETCHTTTVWTPSTFNHDVSWFRINTGKHRGLWQTCMTCHPTPGGPYTSFTCFNCHEHAQSIVDGHHTPGLTRNGIVYSYESWKCYACHEDA
jgi:hypothetical protein